jgi:hypothetical protein
MTANLSGPRDIFASSYPKKPMAIPDVIAIIVVSPNL